MVLRDAGGAEVAAGSGASGTLTVPDVHRWAPGDGYLYDLEVQLVDGDGHAAGQLPPERRRPDRRGAAARSSSSTASRSTSPASACTRTTRSLGKGHNDALHAPRLRAAGVDRRELLPDLALPLLARTCWTRRPARHPGHRRDRRGRPEHGPRRRDLRRPRATPRSPQRRSTTPTREVHAQAIRELVARDKNHPSVVLWSIANEPESETAEARGLLPAAVRADPRAGPDAAGRVRQRHARPVRQVPGLASSATC